MIGIILVSHGNTAPGLLDSSKMIFGEAKDVVAVSLLSEESPNQVKEKMQSAMRTMKSDEILFLVDLWGGTPCHQACLLCEEEKEKRAVVAGVNLPLLLEALIVRETMKVKELQEHLMKKAVDVVRCFPSIGNSFGSEGGKKKARIPEGTMMGDGKMKYVLVRVDSRLLHGQVVTSWIPSVHPDRVIIVSDRVARDELRKKLILQAAPSSVKVHVVPLAKMLAVANDPRFGKTKALLLFEDLQDVVKAVEGGLELKEINIGSMAHKDGKVTVNKALSLDESDIVALEQLKQHQIHFDVRKVPSDTSEDIESIIEKARQMLRSKE